MKKIKYLGNYIAGKFVLPSMDQIQTQKSPADFEDKIIDIPSTFEWVPSLCVNGKAAHLNWAKTNLKIRMEKLLPLKKIFTKKQPELAEIISRETGKPLWESQAEVGALIKKIDITFNQALKRVEFQEIKNEKGELIGATSFQSRGLILVIGPFNFPMHLAFSQILAALVTGNTVIFKPSEKTVASGQMLTECFHELNLPAGVFQMIQASSFISKKLVQDPLVDGILFTGSYEVGQKIKEMIKEDYWKILALEMGGYNSTLIWDYSEREKVLEETLKSCFLTAGQRCSSTSQILIHKNQAKDFIPHFLKEVQKIKIGHWKTNPFMGPLIDEQSVRRFTNFQKEAKQAGLNILQEGQVLQDLNGHYVSPGVYQVSNEQAYSFGHQETFTPQILIYEVEDMDTAVKMVNHSGYGLVLALFTQENKIKEEMLHRAKVGLMNFNRSTCGASSFLPFGGLGKSGNDRPAGAFMIDSCTSPMAQLGEV